MVDPCGARAHAHPRPPGPLPVAGLALRPVRPSDDGLLDALLVAARPWLAGLPADLLRLQRVAQERDHAERAGTDGHLVVEVDGVPVGRVWSGCEQAALRVLDLALLPAARGRGTGRHVVEALLAAARADGAALRVSVARDDPAARAFWTRLGLRQTGSDPVRLHLEVT